jgi:hypothetical protein
MVASDGEEMFGATWRPGDWFLRDADGVLRLTSGQASTVATEVATSAGSELRSLLA